jgi:glycosyltransferase involved in cell wall biosynthesis
MKLLNPVPSSNLAPRAMPPDDTPALWPLRVLFVGETWMGSASRALRDGLKSVTATAVSEVDVSHYLPPYRSIVMRGANRLLRPLQCRELERKVIEHLRMESPDVLLVYKGYGIGNSLVNAAKAAGAYTINVFPDYSPHAYGRALGRTVGEYDLVVSTKPFHPRGWKLVYGYSNKCVCVPHGYDPAVHYWSDAPIRQALDVVLVATWRPEYHRLMLDFATEMSAETCQVGIAGHGWLQRRGEFPARWRLTGSITGRAYGEYLRSGRIAVAPVQREVLIDGKRQPGDEESTRTYELAAARCFFLHRRTDYVQTVFDERTEVPLWDDAKELAVLVRHYLPREEERLAMAAAAHARAVPEYSVANRAGQVMAHVRAGLAARHRTSS